MLRILTAPAPETAGLGFNALPGDKNKAGLITGFKATGFISNTQATLDN
jgi:hypothetical protein